MFNNGSTVEISNNVVLIKELKKLNPEVTFESDNPAAYVVVNCDPALLKLPKPFYLSENHGITNKHRTDSGIYTSLDVLC